jgi:Spy/CpxP family protein refolding chaperone
MLMPPPETTTTRVTSLVVILLVFLAGAAVGAVGMRTQLHREGRHLPGWADGGKPIVMDKWKRELNLTDDQVSKIETTLDDFALYYDNLLAGGHESIVKVLTPEQRVKFERMVQNAKR